ncbi:prolyl oligopeptidase family serine peptidase [bacterium]|nr:prolyl oligopeptidase family serine peptidase [Planctomicrobium sp.]MDA7503429.1 prolyl oligopeptidase family serine peptidase [bacterium]MDB4802293.1 prolyl oligopeptidase family serine peptidase [bacterium]
MQTSKKLNRSLEIELDYLLSLPENYESKDEWPLILFLHGAGERGDNLDRVKIHGPPKLIASGEKLPFIVVSPQCPKDRWWNAVELTALLDEIVEKHNVDESRIYVTGLSMGGFGTWSLAMYSPKRFAAIAPICGGGDRQFGKYLKDIPAWIFHGAKDSAVPVQRSIEMAEAIKKSGGDPKLTIYPEANHDSWTESYANPELYDWFLSHRIAEEE